MPVADGDFDVAGPEVLVTGSRNIFSECPYWLQFGRHVTAGYGLMMISQG
jgi:hypothetical protein